MRKLAMAFLFCLTSSIANAQAFSIEKRLLCDRTPDLLSALREKYKEEFVWAGDDVQDKSKYALFVNFQLGTWTLLQMTPEYACILGVGAGAIMSPAGPKI